MQVPRGAFKTRGEFFKKHNLELVPVLPDNLVDTVWGKDQPVLPETKVFVHEVSYAGRSVADKYKDVKSKLGDVSVLLVAALDDIAWLLNMRCTDIDYNPLFMSYLIVHNDDPVHCTLYINAKKVDDEAVKKHLDESKIAVKPYE